MKCLGVDYGRVRIGLAISDEMGKIAFPLKTLRCSDSVARELCDIVLHENIGVVVLGLPPVIPGFDATLRSEIEDFAKLIGRTCDTKIMFENEMFSTRIAEASSKENSDASAAAVILQSFLDK